MDKQTKTLLGVAVVAGLGYFLYTQYSKPKPKAFANLMSSDESMDFKIIAECVGDSGTVMLNGQKYYNCCKMGYFGKSSAGGKCDGGAEMLSSID
jgi:hypothetical protein